MILDTPQTHRTSTAWCCIFWNTWTSSENRDGSWVFFVLSSLFSKYTSRYKWSPKIAKAVNRIHHQLICFTHVELEMVVYTPDRKAVHHSLVLWVSISYNSRFSIEVQKLARLRGRLKAWGIKGKEEGRSVEHVLHTTMSDTRQCR